MNRPAGNPSRLLAHPHQNLRSLRHGPARLRLAKGAMLCCAAIMPLGCLGPCQFTGPEKTVSMRQRFQWIYEDKPWAQLRQNQQPNAAIRDTPPWRGSMFEDFFPAYSKNWRLCGLLDIVGTGRNGGNRRFKYRPEPALRSLPQNISANSVSQITLLLK